MTGQAEGSSRTLTILFTDLQDSTKLWEQNPQAMKADLERHDAILREAVEGANGQVVKTTGDGLMAVFASALDGVRACLTAQQRLQDEAWGEPGPLRVRMGLHVGEAQPRAGDYYGPAVNRAARLTSAAHGGQVLLSGVAANLLFDLLPEGTTLQDLGEHRLKDLARSEHIFQLLHPPLPADFPPLASLDNRPNNLPAQPTALIGREVELGEIMKRLATPGVQLLTLTGPGGIGKTRLALQAAAELIDRFEDGVTFVDLAPIQAAEAVPGVIAQTLGLRETNDRPLLDALKEHLRGENMLLLLDNFEQVTAAASAVVELLRDCPRLKLLVTSREALHVRGEYIYPVSPLALPTVKQKQLSVEQLTQYDAVQLFIERAQAVKPDFKVTNENAPAVAEICIQLDGLPLAIELAAARIRLFPPRALLERLGGRMKLLRGGARDLPVRQQTMRDTINWSYELLDRGEQRLFELLSAFPGGCWVEAVEAVANGIERLEETGIDILEGLASLEEKSLIRQVDQDSGAPRLAMLETIREYASERLAADPAFCEAARRGQAAYFADFTRRQWERLKDRQQAEAFEELVANIENVRTAWGYWAQAGDLQQMKKFVEGLWLLYDRRGWYHAGIELITDMLNALSSTPFTPERLEQEIVLHTSLARALLVTKGYTAEVEQAYQRALELSEAAGEIPQLFPILRGLASLYTYVGKFDKAAQLGERILSLAERLDDAGMRVEGHLVFGYSTVFAGDSEQGMSHLEQSIAGYDPELQRARGFTVGNDPGVVGLSVSGLLLWLAGYPEQGLQRSNRAVALATRLGHPYSMAYALFHNSFLCHGLRETEGMYERAQAVLEIAEEHQFHIWRAVATCLCGAALSETGQHEKGLELVEQGIHLYQGLNTPPVFWPLLLQIQVEACLRAGKPEQGLRLLEAAMSVFSQEGDDLNSVELYRLKGVLLLVVSPERAPEAEAWFVRAVDGARRAQLLAFELRAAVHLCRLWQEQGKAEQGRQLLRSAYEKFSEGFNTVDLKEAQELLNG